MLKDWIQKKKTYIIVFIVALLPRMFLALVYPHEIRLIQDEIGTLAVAAKSAGLNWTDVVSTTRYYGFGYFILWAPIFALIDNFFVIQYALRISAALLFTFPVLISTWISKNYFKINDEKFLVFSGLVCSYAYSVSIRNITNECAITFVTWLISLLLAKLHMSVGERKKEILYSGLLIICMLWGQTIHTRLLLCVCAAIFTYIIYKWCFSRTKGMGYWAILLLLIGTFGIQKFIGIVQRNVWQTGGKIENGTLQIIETTQAGTHMLNSTSNWLAVLFIILGNLFILCFFSCGFILIAFSLLKLVLKCIFNRSSNGSIDENYIVQGAFWGMCTIGMIVGLAIGWGPGVAVGIEKGMGELAYNYKGITHIRYIANFASPLLMVCLAFLYHNRQYIINKIRVYAIILICMVLFWGVVIVPFIQNADNINTFKSILIGLDSLHPIIKYWIPVIFIILIAVFVASGIVKNKVLTTLTVVAVIVLYNRISIDVLSLGSQNHFESVNAGYRLIKNIEQQEITLCNDIYVPNKYSMYRMQGTLPKYHIVPSLPNQSARNALVFANSPEINNELINMGYKAYYLDCEEVVWVKDSPLAEYVEKISIVNKAQGFEVPKSSFIYEKGNYQIGQYILKREGHGVVVPIEINANGDYIFKLDMDVVKQNADGIGHVELVVDDLVVLQKELECTTGIDYIQVELGYELANIDQVLVRLYLEEDVIIKDYNICYGWME